MTALSSRTMEQSKRLARRTGTPSPSLARLRSGPPSSTGSAMNELSSNSDDDSDGRTETALAEAAWAAAEAAKGGGMCGSAAVKNCFLNGSTGLIRKFHDDVDRLSRSHNCCGAKDNPSHLATIPSSQAVTKMGRCSTEETTREPLLTPPSLFSCAPTLASPVPVKSDPRRRVS